MKFLYSDTQDYVDPSYDFINDRHAPEREKYWSDAYAHEVMDPAPYDGLLVAMSAVRQAEGVPSSKVRYSTREEQRMLRDGARKFLRFDGPKFRDSMLMGDCGAFAYADLPRPAFSPAEVVEFYLDAGFTHGVSPDHIIFDCDPENPPLCSMPEEVRFRYDVTLENAEQFLRLSRQEGSSFEPMGAVQGWSPESMGDAAASLEQMGFRYLAVGGLVPLKPEAIKAVLTSIRSKISPETRLHLLGFAKADHIHEFTEFGIASFDSTSPLIRAFKDNKANYYIPAPGGGLDYYAAIRIPQAIENARLVQGVKRGLFSAEELSAKEGRALESLRAYDREELPIQATLEAVLDYHQFLIRGSLDLNTKQQDKELEKVRENSLRTLSERPWKRCKCDICSSIGVEVIIFRSSNRNKRRGFHNLGVYHRHVQSIRGN